METTSEENGALRVAIDCRPLLEGKETGVTVYTRAMIDSLSLKKNLNLDLFYFSRHRANWIHDAYPKVRHMKLSSSLFHLRTVFGGQKLPHDFFTVSPDLIWIPDRRPFFKTTIPLVMTFHDRVPETCSTSLSRKSKIWHKLFPLKYLMSIVNGALFPTESVKHSFQSRGELLDLPSVVTYEGPQVSDEFDVDSGDSSLKDSIVFIGSNDPRKRIEWFVRLAQAFPNEQFVWIGESKSDRRFASKKHHLPSNLISLGQVPTEVKTSLLSSAKVYLALSSYEGFDLPLLEAISLNCPVLMSDIEVHRELYSGSFFVDFYDLKTQFSLCFDTGFSLAQKRRNDLNWSDAAEQALFLFSRVVHHKD